MHLTNTSYRWLGEYYGKVIKKVAVDKTEWKPLSPKQIYRIGNEIYAKFNVPEGPLQFDTSLVLAKENYGFEYYDINSSASISSVSIVSADTVKVTLNTVPTGRDQRLRYAYTGTAGSNAGADQEGSARGNLRDSDNTSSQYGNTLYNWAVHFDKSITQDNIAPSPFPFSLNVGSNTNNITPTVTFLTSDNVAVDHYQVKIDSGSFSTQVSPYTLTTPLSDGAHTITVRAYDASGNYRDAAVSLTVDATNPSSFSSISPANNTFTSNRTPIFSWSASSDSGSGLNKYQLYIDGVMDMDNIPNSSASTSASSILSCGNHLWYIKAIDNNGNSTNSNTFNLNINCAAGFISPIKPNTSATTLTLSPDGKLNLNNIPADITQIAISTTPDFKDVSWEDISKKDELLQKYADASKLYLKLKSKDGAVSDTITYEKSNSNNPTTPSSSYPTGTLLKLPNSPRVYVIIDGKKKWISTPEVFEQLGYKWTDIKTITETELNTLPDYEDNLIRQAGDYKVYLVVNGTKRHIPNPEVFLDYGFSWSDIKEVDKTTMDKYKETFLIKESGKNEIYYIINGIRKWIPNMDTFNSYNDKQEDVQIISKKEMASYPLSNLIKLNNSNDIYLTEGNIKKHIPNPTVFNKYKLNWNYVMSVNQIEFNFYKDGGELK